MWDETNGLDNVLIGKIVSAYEARNCMYGHTCRATRVGSPAASSRRGVVRVTSQSQPGLTLGTPFGNRTWRTSRLPQRVLRPRLRWT